MSTGGAAAFAVIILGLIVGVMVAMPSVQRAGDDLKDAREEMSRELLDIKNTRFSISSLEHNTSTSVLNISLANEGVTVWDVVDFHVLVNGTLVGHRSSPGTYCYPNGELEIMIRNVTSPSSVTVVGPWGIGDTCDV